MGVGEVEASVVCTCVCYGVWVSIIPNITCKECIEKCIKEEHAKRIEYRCFKESPPPDEVEYE